MAGIAAGGEVHTGPATGNTGRRRAAGIYGAIIAALGLVMVALKDLVLLHLH